MKLEALVDAKTKVGANEGIEQVQQLIRAFEEEEKSTPSVLVSDVQPKRGLFETSYFASITVDFAVGITSGLISNLIYESFKSIRRNQRKNKTKELEDSSHQIEIDTESFSIIFIISDSDIDNIN